jgi:hypothetical protein
MLSEKGVVGVSEGFVKKKMPVGLWTPEQPTARELALEPPSEVDLR